MTHTEHTTVAGLTDEEQAALRYASMPALTPAEGRELLHFLGYHDELPEDRVAAVVEKIAERFTREWIHLKSLADEASDLLADARCSFADPGLVRGWGRRRRRVRDAIIDTED